MTLHQFLIFWHWFLSQECTLTWMSSTGSPVTFEGVCRAAVGIAQANHGYLHLVTPIPSPLP